MKRRAIRRSKKFGAPGWMVTYSDLVTLILVFFILLFSMSQIDQIKFEAVAESFQNRMIFDFLPSAVPLDHPSESTDTESGDLIDNLEEALPVKETEEDGETKEDLLEKLMADVENYLNEHGLKEVISADRTDRGVVLVLQESILFDSGEAEILEEGKPFLSRVGLLLKDIPNHVNVEGHTDARPISNYRYPSNWELSGARASSVIRYLIEEENLRIDRFSSVGYADTMPIVPNTTPENLKKNRRVEIVILETGNQSERGADH